MIYFRETSIRQIQGGTGGVRHRQYSYSFFWGGGGLKNSQNNRLAPPPPPPRLRVVVSPSCKSKIPHRFYLLFTTFFQVQEITRTCSYMICPLYGNSTYLGHSADHTVSTILVSRAWVRHYVVSKGQLTRCDVLLWFVISENGILPGI